MEDSETTQQAPAGTLVLAFCPGCDTAFLKHAGRPWSPCCAMEPVNELDLNELIDLANTLTDGIAPLLQLLQGDGVDRLRGLLASAPAVPAAAESAAAASAEPPALDGASAAPPAAGGESESQAAATTGLNGEDTPPAEQPVEEPPGAVGAE